MAVYLLHFERPISPNHTCLHYLGFANNVDARIKHHRAGTSKARLLEVAHERGIGFEVVRVWEDGDRELERRLKRWHNSRLLCPVCLEERKKHGETECGAADCP